MARLGAPARRFRHASIGERREKGGERREKCVVGALERARAAIPPRVHWRKKGEGRRKERVVRGWRAQARPRGDSATRPFKRENHEWTRMDTNNRNHLNHEKHETHEKNVIFVVQSLLLDGSPLQSVHALLSPFFSLLPTLEAHCKVSTHYFLLSSPSSLLSCPFVVVGCLYWSVGETEIEDTT